MTVRRFIPALLLGWALITGALVFGDVHHPARTAFSLVFLAFVPGLAILRLIGLRDLEMTILLAVPLSLSLDAATSGVLVYTGSPSWNLGVAILLAVTIGAVLFDGARPKIAGRSTPPVGGKLGEEARQAEVIRALLDGGSLADAADAADVNVTTLQRAMRRSGAFRSAVAVASRGLVEDDGGS